MNKKKMGGLGKLSQFSGIRRQEEVNPPKEGSQESESEIKSQESGAKTKKLILPQSKIHPPYYPSEGGKSKIQNQDKLVTVNIKVTKSQRDWLAETASQVRDNNIQPVPSQERVYPQHLIGVAIDLLRSAEVDWAQVKGIEDLREQLQSGGRLRRCFADRVLHHP